MKYFNLKRNSTEKEEKLQAKIKKMESMETEHQNFSTTSSTVEPSITIDIGPECEMEGETYKTITFYESQISYLITWLKYFNMNEIEKIGMTTDLRLHTHDLSHQTIHAMALLIKSKLFKNPVTAKLFVSQFNDLAFHRKISQNFNPFLFEYIEEIIQKILNTPLGKKVKQKYTEKTPSLVH